MNTSYNAMTVKEVLSEIAGKRILVPEFIDPPFDWYYSKKIESIFESILKGYPIGGFTFWNLEDPVPNIMFYEMTEHYTDSSRDRQKRFEMGFRAFRALLDGGKRLNSLYIGLMGTYTRYTKPENEGEDEYPPRTLYLNLWRPELSESEPEQRGHFRFLTEKDYEKETQNGAVWVKAGRVLDEDVPSILGSVSVPPEGAKEAEEVLGRLADGICSRKIVCGCSVEGGPLDSVIGLLTQGGSIWRYNSLTKFFYLLAANWDEARAEFERLKDFVKKDSFRFSRFDEGDILKICLALIGDEVELSAERFSELIPKIRKEWRQIKSAIRRTSSLFRNIYGEKSPGLDSNPALVIMYWFYKKGEAAWPKDSEDLVEKSETAVKKWMAFCDSLGFDWEKNSPVFKKIIDETENEVFPFAALRESIIDDYIRERIAEDDFEEILTSSWDRRDLFGSRGAIDPEFLLPLLSSERAAGALKEVKAVHIHPRSFFEDPEKLAETFKENPRDLLFAADPKNWDSVLNLCLMPVEKANMKEQMPLKEWAEKTGTPNSRLCVDDDVSLDIKDFRAFIENRRKRIKAILRDLLD